MAIPENDDLPLKDTFARFLGEVDVTIDGNTFKAQVGMIGDGYGTPIEAGIIVLRVVSDLAAIDIERVGNDLVARPHIPKNKARKPRSGDNVTKVAPRPYTSKNHGEA